MSTPLYEALQTQDLKCNENGNGNGNKGLWFDRFYDQYDNDKWAVLKPKPHDDKKGNSYWLTKHFHQKRVGHDKQLKNYSLLQQQLTQSLQGDYQVFSSNWHFVTGMGNPHPTENGFTWHPTLGVPYLTGAAVKGLVRNYLENYYIGDDKKSLLLNWFGSTDKAPQSDNYETQSGHLLFFDAIPIEPVSLVVDIMTPHMGDWYQQGAENPNQAKTVPADWHDPNPVTFLAANKAHLLFSYALRQYPERADTKLCEPINLDDVKEVLSLALTQFGAGGKTATGYGAMTHDIKKEQAIREIAKKNQIEREKEQQLQQIEKEKEQQLQQAVAQLSSDNSKAFYIEMEKKQWRTNKDAFWVQGVIESWIEKLEALADPELQKLIEELMDIHFKGARQDPDKTTGKRNKPVYKPRVIEIVKRLNSIRTS